MEPLLMADHFRTMRANGRPAARAAFDIRGAAAFMIATGVALLLALPAGDLLFVATGAGR